MPGASPLNQDGRSETVRHSLVEHDWGRAATLQASPGCHVRRLEIDRSKAYGRAGDDNSAAHWVVVAGTARLRLGDRQTTIATGDNADARPGMACELANSGDRPLILVETVVSV